MSQIYKKLEPNAVSITPFPVYKSLTAVSGGASNNIELFKGTFYGGQKQINTSTWPTTTNSEYQYLIHDSLKHLFYNTYDTYRPELSINRDKKNIFNDVICFSIPRNSFGEGIRKGTVTITAIVSGSTHTIIDDKNGNLVDTTISGSLTHKLETYRSGSIGRWNFADGYEFKKGDGLNIVTDKFIYDRSDNYNLAKIKNIQFLSGSLGQTAYFYNSGSNIIVPYNEIFNFRRNEDFYISCLASFPATSSYTASTNYESIITKSKGTKVYPFDIRLLKTSGNNGKIQFSRDDGTTTSKVTSSLFLNDATYHHIVCQKTGSLLELYIDGTINSSGSDFSSLDTHNSCSLYFGMLGNYTQHLHANIKEIEVKETAFSQAMILEMAQSQLSQSFDYYVGNVFYSNGIVTLTNEQSFYKDFISVPYAWTFNGYGTNKIFEYEFLCSVEPGDFNYSWNDSLIKESRGNQKFYKDFATGSLFTPYVTKIGLYNDNYELMAVGKISKPIPRLKNMETTYIIRFDV